MNTIDLSSGGSYGTGSRIKLQFTRTIIDAIHSGELAKAITQRDAIFGFETVVAVPGNPGQILTPALAWADGDAFRATAKKLTRLFIANFEKYEAGVAFEVKAAGPAVQLPEKKHLAAA